MVLKATLNKDTAIFLYSELSSLAKDKARLDVLANDNNALKNEMSAFKSLINKDINFCVNDRNKIPHFIRRRNHIKRTITDIVYCEKYIQENLCHFLADGTYVTYL